MSRKWCAFLRRLIGLSPVPPPTEVRATIRGELIDLIDDESNRKLTNSPQSQTSDLAHTLAPKPMQKPEPRPVTAPPIKSVRKKPVRYGGSAQYPMRRRGIRRK